MALPYAPPSPRLLFAVCGHSSSAFGIPGQVPRLIFVLNQNTIPSGNDFGLDDISFMSCAPCTVTTAVTITEPPPLTLTATTTDEFCNRADGTAGVTVMGGNGNYTYLWTPSSQIVSTATGLTAGNYSVSVNDANGCAHDTVVVVNFIPGPTANAGVDVSMCVGNSLTLNATGGGNYLWSPATGLSSTSVANPVFIGVNSTSFTVTVTDVNGCTASDSVQVDVYLTPEAVFSATSACFNNATVFTDNSIGNIAQWQWNFGDTSSGLDNFSSIQNPQHTYNSSGSSLATLVAISPEGCIDSATKTVTVNPLPVTSFSSTTVCIGTQTNFTDMSTIPVGTITAWSWNFGDPPTGSNNTSNVQNPAHVFSATGVYSVFLTTTSNNGCQSSTTLQAVVLAPPVAAFTATSACLNTATVFSDASVNALNWSWTFGDGGISTSQNPTHIYPSPGTYIVTLITTSTGACADTVVNSVTVYPLPTVNFISDSVCQGDTSAFFNFSSIPGPGTISLWSWDFGDGSGSALQNPTHVYAAAGSYTVTLTAISSNGCVGSASKICVVYPLPLADFDFTPSPTAELVDVVNFNDLSTGGPSQWLWDFGDGDTSTLQYPSHLFSDTGVFVVTLIITSPQGCKDTVQRFPEVQDFAFYIPNSFSPNGDDLNELFFGKGVGITEFEMSIFDRWGNRIFYCKVNDLPQTLPCMWDGKVQDGISNKTAQEDVYVWKVNLMSIFGKPYNYIGNVSIIR